MTNERKNYPSASPWRRRELCARSWQLELEAERIGQIPATSSEAASGIRIHAALAGEKVELSESEQRSVDLLKERTEFQVQRIFGDKPYKVITEERLWLKPVQ